MKTSRKDGVLVLKTAKPYRMAINGNIEQRNTIIAYDINNQAESAAFDLEQYFDAAIFDMADMKSGSSQSTKEENDDFFEKDCPTDKEIDKKAAALEIIIRTNKSVLLSKILETFNEIILAGLIKVDGGINMTPTIWSSIHRDDKIKIIFWYAAFFVNPLQRLSLISAIMDGNSAQGQTKNSGTPSEQHILPLEE